VQEKAADGMIAEAGERDRQAADQEGREQEVGAGGNIDGDAGAL